MDHFYSGLPTPWGESKAAVPTQPLGQGAGGCELCTPGPFSRLSSPRTRAPVPPSTPCSYQQVGMWCLEAPALEKLQRVFWGRTVWKTFSKSLGKQAPSGPGKPQGSQGPSLSGQKMFLWGRSQEHGRARVALVGGVRRCNGVQCQVRRH